MKRNCMIIMVIMTAVLSMTVTSRGEKQADLTLVMSPPEIMVRQSIRYQRKMVFPLQRRTGLSEKAEPKDEIDRLINQGIPIRPGKGKDEQAAQRMQRIPEDMPRGVWYQRQYLNGLKKYQKGSFESAEKIFNGLLNIFPKGPLYADIHYWLAQLHFEREEWSQARKKYLLAAGGDEQNPLTAYAVYSLGLMACRDGDSRKAVTYFQDLMERFLIPELEPAMLLRLGESFYLLEEYRAAARNLKKLVDGHPEYEPGKRAGFWLAECFLASDDFKEADAHYRDFLKSSPSDELREEALLGVAWSSVGMGNFVEGAELFRKLAAQSTSDHLRTRALYWSAKTCLEAGLLQEALNRFLEFRNRYPESSLLDEAILGAGLAQYETGLFRNAASTFQTLAGKYPSSPRVALAYYMAGESYGHLKEYSLARQAYNLVIRMNSDTQLIQKSLLKAGWCSYLSADYQGAITVLRRFIIQHSQAESYDEAAYWLAEGYLAAGNYSQSAYLFKQTADKDGPRADDAQYGLGWTYLKKKLWTEAAMAFGDLLRRFPESPFKADASLQRAQSLYFNGQFRDALADFREYADKYPESTESHQVFYKIGTIYLELSEYDKAFQTFSEVEQKFPASPYVAEAVYLQALVLLRWGSYPDALEGFTRVMNAYPDTKWGKMAMIRRGDVYYSMNRFEEAAAIYRKCFEDLLQLFPGLAAEAQVSLTKALVKLNDGEKVRQAVRDFRSLFPDDRIQAPIITYIAAKFEMQEGNRDRSREEFQRLIDSYPDHKLADDAVLSMAQQSIREEEYLEALKILEDATQRYPEGNTIDALYFELGMARFKLGRFFQAGESFGRVRDLHPESDSYPKAIYYEALSSFEMGDMGKFNRGIDMLIKEFPDHPLIPEACLRAAANYADEGNYQKALDLFKKAVSFGRIETGPQAQFQIGRMYRLMGDLNRSVIEFLKVPYVYPDNKELGLDAQMEAALVYLKTGNRNEARKLLQSVIEHSPGDNHALRARTLLDSLEGRGD